MADKRGSANAVYSWSGTDRQGKKVSGEMDAQGPAFVRAVLRRQGVIVKSVKKKPKPLFAKKIKPKDVAIASRQIATMLSAGIPIAQSYKAIASGSDHAKIQEVFDSIRMDVEGGTNLSDALAKHPKQFDSLYTSLVSVGEQSGNLDDLMEKIATYKENIEEIKAKVKGAMWYPVAVLVVGFLVTALLLVFVIPQFENLFSSFGASLPALTAAMIELSRGFRDNWVMIFGVLFGAIAILVMTYRRSAAMRHNVDRLSLKMPVFGTILRKSAVARYARTMATMFGSGVTLVDGLESVAGATGNMVYHDACLEIREEVSTGQALSIAMAQTGLFPTMVLQMTATGEESGELESMLNKAADFYEREVREAVDNMSKLIEPIMITVLGGIVGTLVIAMYLPIFMMGSVI